jgi:MscS family membrane protein
MQRALIFAVTFTACVAIGRSMASAQGIETPHPLQPSETSSPRATLRSFVNACNELYDLAETEKAAEDFNAKVLPAAERIRDCLDLGALPDELRDMVGLESSVYLKEVLDRIELPGYDEIPGVTADEEEPISRWRIPGSRLTIARVQSGPQEGAYLLSSETVRQAAKLYSAAKQLPYRSEGPRVSAGFYNRYVALTKRQPTLAADTSSPRGTLTLFLDKTNEVYQLTRSEQYVDRTEPEFMTPVTQIFRCLDLSEVPEYSREYYASEVAACLKEILDRVTLPPAEEIPGPEDVSVLDGGESLARWQIPNTKITIGRIEEGPRRGEYLFTNNTVQSAVTLHKEVKQQPYRANGRPVSPGLYEWYLSDPGNATVAGWLDRLPDWIRCRLFGMAYWQWFGLMVATAIGLTMMIAAYWVGGIRSEKAREKSFLRYWLTIGYAGIAMLIPLAYQYVVWDALTIRGTTLYVLEFSANLAFLVALIVIILAVSNRLADTVVLLRKSGSNRLNATLVQIAFRSAGMVAAVIVFLEGGQHLGFPLTTLLAGAGISGLAIALAAQSLLKGLFGTVTILFDKPYQSGERIIVKGYDGVVEDIGMRATKLRLLTGHLASIPNDQMADSEIENIGRRPHIRRTAVIEMPSGTPTAKVKRALEIVRAAVDGHEGMREEFPPRVFLRDLNEASIGIFMIYWYHPPNYWDFLAFSEKVNLQIMEQLEAEGIDFAAPALTVHTPDGPSARLNAAMARKDPDSEGSPKAND